MINTLPEGFQITRNWRPDGRAYDPSTSVIWFEYRGELFEATNRLGPGWPMVVRTAQEDRTFWSATVDWENWGQVVEQIQER